MQIGVAGVSINQNQAANATQPQPVPAAPQYQSANTGSASGNTGKKKRVLIGAIIGLAIGLASVCAILFGVIPSGSTSRGYTPSYVSPGGNTSSGTTSSASGSGSTSSGTTSGVTQGTLTITGIPSTYNGKYITFMGSIGYIEYLVGCESVSAAGDSMTLVQISNGRAALPIWLMHQLPQGTSSSARYNGNDTADDCGIIIYNSRVPKVDEEPVAFIFFPSDITFNNGSVTLSANDGAVIAFEGNTGGGGTSTGGSVAQGTQPQAPQTQNPPSTYNPPAQTYSYDYTNPYGGYSYDYTNPYGNPYGTYSYDYTNPYGSYDFSNPYGNPYANPYGGYGYDYTNPYGPTYGGSSGSSTGGGDNSTRIQQLERQIRDDYATIENLSRGNSSIANNETIRVTREIIAAREAELRRLRGY
ncbi:MAG: hypothetical protein LBQ94_13000 [Treponema sp.]|nr:hypothetical protein [Treponema sp.]